MNHIIEQDQAVQNLQSALSSGRVHHAWIFRGPQGVGKFTFALATAKILLCPHAAPDLTGQIAACDTCKSCSMFASSEGPETHPDLHIIRKEMAATSAFADLRKKKQTNIPVNLLRELMVGGMVEGKFVAPVIAQSTNLDHGKVFIIDEAELLDGSSQNALLKSLEEPPANTWIFLITSADHRLLPTIRSRCQTVAFSPLSAESVSSYVERYTAAVIAECESEIAALTDRDDLNKTEKAALEKLQAVRAGLDLSDKQIERIMRFARGSFGRAQLAIDYRLDHWQASLEPMLKSLLQGQPTEPIGKTLATLVDDFAAEWVARHANASKESANKAGIRHMLGLLGENCRQAMQYHAQHADPNDPDTAESRMWPWLRGVELLQEAERHMNSNVNVALLLDNLAVQWANTVAPIGNRR